MLGKILKPKFEVVPDELKMLVRAMKALNNVKKTCFGLSLGIFYKNHINAYKEAHIALNKKVSTKVHAIVIHVPAFLESMADKYPGKGICQPWLLNLFIVTSNSFMSKDTKFQVVTNCINQNC